MAAIRLSIATTDELGIESHVTLEDRYVDSETARKVLDWVTATLREAATRANDDAPTGD